MKLEIGLLTERKREQIKLDESAFSLEKSEGYITFKPITIFSFKSIHTVQLPQIELPWVNHESFKG